jgi:hypothetical protein
MAIKDDEDSNKLAIVVGQPTMLFGRVSFEDSKSSCKLLCGEANTQCIARLRNLQDDILGRGNKS